MTGLIEGFRKKHGEIVPDTEITGLSSRTAASRPAGRNARPASR